jgi:hypothetical protein
MIQTPKLTQAEESAVNAFSHPMHPHLRIENQIENHLHHIKVD